MQVQNESDNIWMIRPSKEFIVTEHLQNVQNNEIDLNFEVPAEDSPGIEENFRLFNFFPFLFIFISILSSKN